MWERQTKIFPRDLIERDTDWGTRIGRTTHSNYRPYVLLPFGSRPVGIVGKIYPQRLCIVGTFQHYILNLKNLRRRVFFLDTRKDRFLTILGVSVTRLWNKVRCPTLKTKDNEEHQTYTHTSTHIDKHKKTSTVWSSEKIIQQESLYTYREFNKFSIWDTVSLYSFRLS